MKVFLVFKRPMKKHLYYVHLDFDSCLFLSQNFSHCFENLLIDVALHLFSFQTSMRNLKRTSRESQTLRPKLKKTIRNQSKLAPVPSLASICLLKKCQKSRNLLLALSNHQKYSHHLALQQPILVALSRLSLPLQTVLWLPQSQYCQTKRLLIQLLQILHRWVL